MGDEIDRKAKRTAPPAITVRIPYAGHRMKKADGCVAPGALSLFLLFFVLYLLTLCPTLFWSDAGEFITTSFELGIAHPAGSPLYLPVAKLFTFLPFGSIAFRVNLVSAFFGALFVALIYRLVLDLLELVGSEPRERIIAALFTAALMGVSEALWSVSVQAEVYSFQHSFLAGILLLLVRAYGALIRRENDRGFRMVCSATFLSGLALGAHITFFFYFPGIALAVWGAGKKGGRWSAAQNAQFLFLFILGASVYAYLPLRATTHPYFNWGEPETLRKFLIQISDRKDSGYHLSLPSSLPNPVRLQDQLFLFSEVLLQQFTALGIPLIVIGGIRLWKTRRSWLLILELLALPNFAFFIRYWPGGVPYIPTFLALSLLLGIGAERTLCFVRRRAAQAPPIRAHLLRWGGLAVLAGGVSMSLVFNLEENAKGSYWLARDLSKTMLRETGQEAVILAQSFYFPLSYLTEIERWRPDVTLISKSDFLAPEYFQRVTALRFPRVAIPEGEESALLRRFVQVNLPEHPIYWEPNNEDEGMFAGHLIPEGHFFRISPENAAITLPVVNLLKERLHDSFRQALEYPYFLSDREGMRLYEYLYSDLGLFLMDQQQCA